ncbi:MAG TPA: plastocyanin/azurin family copper-binding protein [Thermoanaerobaculia bacterium]|jgi:plastocyanin|nr:plastocyanin/azurin family copper-binding protein [Thermoanaerobaculia bacterium]
MAEHKVTIKNMKYSPNPIVIQPGDSVYWVNEEDDVDMEHTATANDKSFDTGTLMGGGQKSKSFQFSKTTPYYCLKHPKSMKGTVEVK